MFRVFIRLRVKGLWVSRFRCEGLAFKVGVTLLHGSILQLTTLTCYPEGPCTQIVYALNVSIKANFHPRLHPAAILPNRIDRPTFP